MKDGRADGTNALAVADPVTAARAWAEMGEAPSPVEASLAQLESAPDLATAENLLSDLIRDNKMTAEALLERFVMLRKELPDQRLHELYADLVKVEHRAPHQPKLPGEASWAATVYGQLAKDTEGRTLRSDMVALLDLYGVVDDSARLEAVGYWQAMDDALRKYNSSVSKAKIEQMMADAK